MLDSGRIWKRDIWTQEWASLVAHTVKSPPAMQETCVQPLGWEDPPGERNIYPLQYSDLENSMDYTEGRIESDMAEWLSLSAFFMVQLSHLYMTTRKTIVFTIWTFVGKVVSLLFNILSRFVIAFLPKSKRLLISWLQSPPAVILEPKKIKSNCFYCFPIYLLWSDGTRCRDLLFFNVEF